MLFLKGLFIVAFFMYGFIMDDAKRANSSKQKKLTMAISATFVELLALPIIIVEKNVVGICLTGVFFCFVIAYWIDWKRTKKVR